MNATRLLMLGLIVAGLVFTASLQAQTLTVLHSFTGGRDGATPRSGLSMDGAGNLYGTTNQGGAGYGTVFKLKHVNNGWILSTLHSFGGGSDGAGPVARVVLGPQNILYGTTVAGGDQNSCTGGCGIIFSLRPAPTSCGSTDCPWLETVIRRMGWEDAFPESEVTFDSAGNFYGSASHSGEPIPGGGGGDCYPSCGLIYKMTPSNGSWTESVAYAFNGYGLGGHDGAYPFGGVTFDSQGNLFGTTTSFGNCGFGTAFELTTTGGNWFEHQFNDFCGAGYGGAAPEANLIRDSADNFYGTTFGLYPGYGTQHGSVFEESFSNGSWAVHDLYTFPQYGGGPAGALVMDSAGNLYGTTVTGGSNPNGTCDAAGCGLIFKMAPSNGSWHYSVLYQFTGGADGAAPYSNLVMDSAGNFYGTASAGGASGKGVVFEFAP